MTNEKQKQITEVSLRIKDLAGQLKYYKRLAKSKKAKKYSAQNNRKIVKIIFALIVLSNQLRVIMSTPMPLSRFKSNEQN